MARTTTATSRSGVRGNSTLSPGQMVAVRDPDAGHHVDECPHVTERLWIGPVEEVLADRESGEATVLFDAGPGPVPADDDHLYVGEEIPEWLVKAFENADCSHHMWHVKHNADEDRHDQTGTEGCEWGQEQVRQWGK